MEDKTAIRKKINAFGTGWLCLLLALLVAFAAHCVNVRNYNNKERVLKNEYERKSEISLEVKEGSSWDKTDSLIEEGSCKGIIYEATVKNLSPNSLKEWQAKFVIKEHCYLNQAWCGSVEIHQFRDGKEVSEKIQDLRKAKTDLEKSSLDYIIDSTGTWLIDLEAGDYILYYPDPEIGKEYPLNTKEDTTVGFIFYTTADAMDLSEFSINYKLHEKFFAGTTGTLFIAAFVLWALVLIAFIIISAIIAGYEKQLQDKERIIKEAFGVFSNFVDAKDPYTHGHSDRVADYSKKIAEKMGLSSKDCENIYWVATLHDIGKCYVPDNILNKPSRLTDEEFAQIKMHTVKGAEMVKGFSSIPGITEGAMYHHERYDGKGYPTGAKGEYIPLIARIICVADSYDAMNSDRVYRKKLSREAIIGELRDGKGTQFDPEIVDAFIEMLEGEEL